MTHKSTTVFLAGTLLVSTLLAFIPTASAQGVPEPEFKFSIGGVPSNPIQPLESQAILTFDYTYTVRGQVIQSELGGLSGTAQAEFDVRCTPSQVVMSGAFTDIITITGQTSGSSSYEGSAQIQITPTREAPGLNPITCEVTGSVPAVGNAIPASNEDRKTFSITPDFFSLIEVSTPLKLRQGGPQKEIPYTIDITNFGNSQTRVKFTFAEGGTPASGKWQGLLPDEIILDPKGGDRAAAQATFTVSTDYHNGWNNEQGQYILTISPEYALNADKQGSPVTVTLLTRVRGVYIPALEPVLLLGAVLGTAFVARHVRDDEE